ncbi:VWA domain-containing protein [Micromonospora olivasterospora]|uniref:VWA domain-containing protein n=1 Tax=Micromonospora olivasterospora TaxID=1880 RepID=UPI0031D3C77A
MRSGNRGVAAVASATALVVVAAGAWFGYRQLLQPGCSGQVELSVAAAPELAPAVQAAAASWVADGAAADGTCVAVDVSASEPVEAPGFRDRLAARSLRAPDGSWGDGVTAPRGAPGPARDGAATPAPGGSGAGGLDPGAIERAVSGWSTATQSGRMLAVIDVSGSMKQPVPSAGNATREQVTVAAASRGLNLFDDSWTIGLWTFSTELDGQRDYREIVPINPLSSNRRPLAQGLAGIRPSAGDTGLYDTMLAAYEEVQDGWEPGRVNSVVLFTDGKNEDANGISQQKLLAELQRIADPDRPVQVVIIGIGNDVSKAELESITKVTGGGTFVTGDPTKIGDIFLKAIALRPNAPR